MRRYLADVLIRIARRLDPGPVFNHDMSLEIDRLTVKTESQAEHIRELEEQLTAALSRR